MSCKGISLNFSTYRTHERWVWYSYITIVWQSCWVIIRLKYQCPSFILVVRNILWSCKLTRLSEYWTARSLRLTFIQLTCGFKFWSVVLREHHASRALSTTLRFIMCFVLRESSCEIGTIWTTFELLGTILLVLMHLDSMFWILLLGLSSLTRLL